MIETLQWFLAILVIPITYPQTTLVFWLFKLRSFCFKKIYMESPARHEIIWSTHLSTSWQNQPQDLRCFKANWKDGNRLHWRPEDTILWTLIQKKGEWPSFFFNLQISKYHPIWWVFSYWNNHLLIKFQIGHGRRPEIFEWTHRISTFWKNRSFSF